MEVRHIQCKTEAEGYRLKKEIERLGWFCSHPFLDHFNRWVITTNQI